MLMSLQVCLKVWLHWFVPERGALQSWAVISLLHLKKPPPQTSFLYMWWSGCASVTTFPSSSNLECMLLVFIQTTRVRVTQMCSITHSIQKRRKTCTCNNICYLTGASVAWNRCVRLHKLCLNLLTIVLVIWLHTNPNVSIKNFSQLDKEKLLS